MIQPKVKKKEVKTTAKKTVEKKYVPTKLEAQNLKDAVNGVNKNPQVSEMIGIPMDNASIKHLRSKFKNK